MAIEIMSALSKVSVSPAAGTAAAGSGSSGGIPLRTTPSPVDTDNGVVQLFPRNGKPEPEEAVRSAEEISAMVEDLQASLEMLQQKNTHLDFSVHEKTDRIVVRITDQETGDVIREIPSEEFLNLAAKLQEMVGLMFDMKV